MGIPFTVPMGFLFTITMGFLFTIALGIQLTISIPVPRWVEPLAWDARGALYSFWTNFRAHDSV